jgi:translation elongation factor EF-G
VEKAEEYRKYMIESVADYDDSLMEKYLMEEEISPEEIIAAIRKATIDLAINPVICGSAFKNKGVQLLLDAVMWNTCLPLSMWTGGYRNRPSRFRQENDPQTGL